MASKQVNDLNTAEKNTCSDETTFHPKVRRYLHRDFSNACDKPVNWVQGFTRYVESLSEGTLSYKQQKWVKPKRDLRNPL